MTYINKTRVCIYGAGSIGSYVGGRLLAAGLPVSFVGRARIAEQMQSQGLHLSDWQGADIHIDAKQLEFHTNDAAAEQAELIIVCVKSAATDEVGRALANRLRPEVVVLSLQNGVGNGAVLARHLPDNAVLAGMISFNVVQQGSGHFHAGTEGELMAAHHRVLEPLLPIFRAAALPLELRTDMLQVQWAKLLMNLNNAINALSGVPLYEQLSQRNYRRCLALLIREAMTVLKRTNIQPANLMPVPMSILPFILSIPDGLFKRLARRMLAIDPMARSSMWEDLEAGRRTEVDWINGEIVKLAASIGMSAPANARIVELIRNAESGGERAWQGEALLSTLKQSCGG
jgi:2-dehydropantoate 2-reductase